MNRSFNVGDLVRWNPEAGRMRGTIQKNSTSPTKCITDVARVSNEEPQYLVTIDKTRHLAMHRGSTCRRIVARPC